MSVALIRNGVVENIIVADLAFAATLGYDAAVEAPDGTFIGQGYANGSLVPMATSTSTLTRLKFARRFTQAERIAIRAAKSTDTIIQDADALMQLAGYIDVKDDDTIQYVNYLATKSLISPDRVDQILADIPIQ